MIRATVPGRPQPRRTGRRTPQRETFLQCHTHHQGGGDVKTVASGAVNCRERSVCDGEQKGWTDEGVQSRENEIQEEPPRLRSVAIPSNAPTTKPLRPPTRCRAASAVGPEAVGDVVKSTDSNNAYATPHQATSNPVRTTRWVAAYRLGKRRSAAHRELDSI